jgi:hypothetical protein
LDLISVDRKLGKQHTGELCGLYSSLTCCTDDQIKEDEMGRACGTHGGEEKCLNLVAKAWKTKV